MLHKLKKIRLADYLARYLKDLGVKDFEMPATPDKVWKAIQSSQNN